VTDSYQLGNAYGEIRLDGSGVERGVRSANRSLDRMGGAVSAAMGTASAAVAGVGVALAGLTVGLGSAVRTAAGFEQSMANVGAISNATDEQLMRLSDTAKEMGRTTSFSASEAADGLGFLAMAGFSVEQQIAALPGTLQLAAAGNLDLADTADIASNVLTGMGLAAEDMTRVADVMARTITTSNTNVQQLGQAFKFVGPQAAAMGLSVETTAAALGKLSDAGLQADMAGTGLRGVLQALTNPTAQAQAAIEQLGVSVFNVDGTMRDLPDIIEQFQAATAGMTDQQRQAALGSIFQTRALNSFQVLMSDTGKDLREYTALLEDSGGTAEEVAEKQLDTLQGQFKLLQSAMESVAIEVGEVLIPILTAFLRDFVIPFVQNHGPKLAQALRWVVERLQGMRDTVQDGIGSSTFQNALLFVRDVFLRIYDVIQPLLPALQSFGNTLRDAFASLREGDAGGAFLGVMDGLNNLRLNILDWALGLVPDLINAVGQWSMAFTNWLSTLGPRLWQGLTDTVQRVVDIIKERGPAIRDALRLWGTALVAWARDNGPMLLTSLGETLQSVVAWVRSTVPMLVESFGGWAATFVEWAIPAGTNLLRTLGRVLADVLGWIGDHAPDLVEQLAEWAAAFVEWVIDLLPTLYGNLLVLLSGVLNWIAENGPPIAAQLGEWALAFVEWVVPTAAKLIYQLGLLFGMLLQWIIDNAVPLAETILNEWAPALSDWIALEAIPRISAALEALWMSIQDWITTTATQIYQEALQMGSKLVDGIQQGITDAWGAFLAWAQARMQELAIMMDPSRLLPGGGGGAAPDTKPVKAMARGGTFRRGDLAVVGEQQAELVQFGSFGRVFPDLSPLAAAARATMPAMAPGGRSVTLNAPMSIGNVTVDSEARMSELQQMIAQRDEALIAQMLDALESIGLEGVA
jgi:TP901 family phage tail tape measure protein